MAVFKGIFEILCLTNLHNFYIIAWSQQRFLVPDKHRVHVRVLVKILNF